MTLSKVVISTSVKIWSISGISRAPLEARGEIISSGGSGVWEWAWVMEIDGNEVVGVARLNKEERAMELLT